MRFWYTAPVKSLAMLATSDTDNAVALKSALVFVFNYLNIW